MLVSEEGKSCIVRSDNGATSFEIESETFAFLSAKP